MPKINYIYAELSENSIKKLKQLFPFRFDKHFGTYITLDWKVDSQEYKDILGKSYKLIVDTFVFDKYAEAIRVNLKDSGLRSINKNPHISWSVSKEFDPYYCNYMLEISREKQKFEPVEIEVVVKEGLF